MDWWTNRVNGTYAYHAETKRECMLLATILCAGVPLSWRDKLNGDVLVILVPGDVQPGGDSFLAATHAFTINCIDISTFTQEVYS